MATCFADFTIKVVGTTQDINCDMTITDPPSGDRSASSITQAILVPFSYRVGRPPKTVFGDVITGVRANANSGTALPASGSFSGTPTQGNANAILTNRSYNFVIPSYDQAALTALDDGSDTWTVVLHLGTSAEIAALPADSYS